MCVCVCYSIPPKSTSVKIKTIKKGVDEIKWAEPEIDSHGRKLRASLEL